jgi:hypothetical protein
MNYESRLERLEQEIAEPVEKRAVAYLHDSDTRPADWMEVKGQRFDRGADEGIDALQRRALESLSLADHNVIVVHYVAAMGMVGRSSPTRPRY